MLIIDESADSPAPAQSQHPGTHPAQLQARQDTALPGWAPLAFAIVLVAVLAASTLWPWGWALPPLH